MIRMALHTDLISITEIYNEAIRNTNATFDTEEKSISQQQVWFKAHNDQYPVIVFEKKGEICAWASLSKWSDRCAYDSTAEVSIYVHTNHRGKGIGQLLLMALIDKAKKNGLHCLLARITGGNENSIHVHEKNGFKNIGTLKEIGKKFGVYQDVHMLQLVF